MYQTINRADEYQRVAEKAEAVSEALRVGMEPQPASAYVVKTLADAVAELAALLRDES